LTTLSALSHIHRGTLWFGSTPMRWWNSVRTNPGQSAITVTPASAYWMLAQRETLTIHAL
jgi:hypothetical protein